MTLTMTPAFCLFLFLVQFSRDQSTVFLGKGLTDQYISLFELLLTVANCLRKSYSLTKTNKNTHVFMHTYTCMYIYPYKYTYRHI